MNNFHLRAILIKLQDRLTDDDRKRLHFFLGNDIPRRIRDDPSLGGTLSLMESLFDQDKINEEDFTFLINAFDEIQCLDAVKLLREHMRRIRTSGFDQSVQSLSVIMPTVSHEVFNDQEDTCNVVTNLIDQPNTGDNNPANIIVNSKQKISLKTLTMTQRCLILFILLTIILVVILIGGCIWFSHLRIKYNNFINEQTKNNEMIQNWKNLVLEKKNIIIHLNKTLLEENKKLQDLNKEIENVNKKITLLKNKQQSIKAIGCRTGLNYCGSTLMNRGASVYQIQTAVNSDPSLNPSSNLFRCIGNIEFIMKCEKGCTDMGLDRSDACIE